MTRQEITIKMPDVTAASVVAALDELERKWGARFREVFKSITIDNGSEFADCAGVELSIFGGKRTTLYYCHPYSSYERGSNEKQNQMIRRHFPKGTNFDNVTQQEIDQATDWLNNYPRLLLGWSNSQALFSKAFAVG